MQLQLKVWFFLVQSGLSPVFFQSYGLDFKTLLIEVPGPNDASIIWAALCLVCMVFVVMMQWCGIVEMVVMVEAQRESWWCQVMHFDMMMLTKIKLDNITPSQPVAQMLSSSDILIFEAYWGMTILHQFASEKTGIIQCYATSCQLQIYDTQYHTLVLLLPPSDSIWWPTAKSSTFPKLPLPFHQPSPHHFHGPWCWSPNLEWCHLVNLELAQNMVIRLLDG